MPLINPQDVAAHAILDTGVHGVGVSTVLSAAHTAIPDAHQTARKIVAGNYTGNGTGRQIAVGFKCSCVIILTTAGEVGDELVLLIPDMTIRGYTATMMDVLAQGWIHATDGFELDTSGYINLSGRTYYYWAISE